MNRRSPWLLIPAAALLFAVVYAATLWRGFPYPELARNAEARLRRQGIPAKIEGLGPGPFPGLSARKVTLGPTEDLPGAVELTEVRMRLSLGRLFSGRVVVEGTATGLGGDLGATYPLTGRGVVAATWSGIDLGDLPRGAALAGLPVAGRTSGEAEVTLPVATPDTLEGRATATLSAVQLGSGAVYGLPVPQLLLGTGRLRLVAADGRLEIEEADFEGGDLGIEFAGTVTLREDAARTQVNGVLSLTPNEKAARELGLAFALFPGVQGSDGRYTARLRGSLAAPRLVKR